MRNTFNDMISRLDFLYYILDMFGSSSAHFLHVRRVWWFGGILDWTRGFGGDS
jgi:hypothetical protein